eukprot:TRINITY_DN5953_c0_g1_i2.p1 TRINITY_DN5953_c0_g1~~TRINITY_DN5953_c0_g1_i2.p1  ORF type:complete len:677 (+),score=124.82 TRINITY_DN5953_c0_g1_i2:160-2031(+)
MSNVKEFVKNIHSLQTPEKISEIKKLKFNKNIIGSIVSMLQSDVREEAVQILSFAAKYSNGSSNEIRESGGIKLLLDILQSNKSTTMICLVYGALFEILENSEDNKNLCRTNGCLEIAVNNLKSPDSLVKSCALSVISLLCHSNNDSKLFFMNKDGVNLISSIIIKGCDQGLLFNTIRAIGILCEQCEDIKKAVIATDILEKLVECLNKPNLLGNVSMTLHILGYQSEDVRKRLCKNKNLLNNIIPMLSNIESAPSGLYLLHHMVHSATEKYEKQLRDLRNKNIIQTLIKLLQQTNFPKIRYSSLEILYSLSTIDTVSLGTIILSNRALLWIKKVSEERDSANSWTFWERLLSTPSNLEMMCTNVLANPKRYELVIPILLIFKATTPCFIVKRNLALIPKLKTLPRISQLYLGQALYSHFQDRFIILQEKCEWPFTVENNSQTKFSDLFKNKKYSDFEIVLKNETIPIHQVVLGSFGKYFDALFSSGMKEAKYKKIEITEEGEQTAFLQMVSFCYGKAFTLQDFDEALELYKVSVFYRISDLEKYLAKILAPHVNLETFPTLWRLTQMTETPDLSKLLIETSLSNWSSLCSSDDNEFMSDYCTEEFIQKMEQHLMSLRKIKAI